MKFYMPVRLYDEPECVARHGEDLASLGRKALIVTGHKSAERNGALGDVCMALEMYGTEYCIFSGVEENPSVETVRKAAMRGKEAGCDYVIGIGGGSPIDAAKAAAFLLKQQDPETADLYDASIPTEAVPVAAVPTTCGTGSEVTGVSVLTLHENKTKKSIPHKIFPTLALVDGKYLANAKMSMIVNTSIDALAHMMESYLSIQADAYSRALVIEGLKIWSSVKDVLDGTRPIDELDYGTLMRASTFAGMAIAQTGTSIPHALSYIVTYDDQVRHGPACGLFLSRFVKEAYEEDSTPLMEAAGFADTDAFDAWLMNLLKDITVRKETLQRAYDAVKEDARMNGTRVHMDEESLARIVQL